VNRVDPTGEDIIVLNAPTAVYGLGHSAVLIGNDKTGWTYISKDGSKLFPNNGPSRYTNSKDKDEKIDSEDKFNKSKYASKYGYTQRIRFNTTEDQDKKAVSAADASAKSWYSVLFNNCADAVSEALKAAGLNPGYTWYGTDNPYADPTDDNSPVPNDRFKKIAENNNADIYNVNLPKQNNTQSGNTNNNGNSWQNAWNILNNWLLQNPSIVVIVY
jgi:hypothetical protein